MIQQSMRSKQASATSVIASANALRILTNCICVSVQVNAKLNDPTSATAQAEARALAAQIAPKILANVAYIRSMSPPNVHVVLMAVLPLSIFNHPDVTTSRCVCCHVLLLFW